MLTAIQQHTTVKKGGIIEISAPDLPEGAEVDVSAVLTLIETDIHQVTPMLHVANCAESIDFFVQILGFRAIFRSEDFALVRRGGASVRIVEEKGREKVDAKNARTTVYVEVYNVDALYLERENALATLPKDDVVKPITQVWNQRELLVRMPDGNWIAFGQEL